MARSIREILRGSDLSGMLLVTGQTQWIGMWLPLNGCHAAVRRRRQSSRGDALAQAAAANR